MNIAPLAALRATRLVGGADFMTGEPARGALAAPVGGASDSTAAGVTGNGEMVVFGETGLGPSVPASTNGCGELPGTNVPTTG